jgi:putative addiction module CopG family antidote
MTKSITLTHLPEDLTRFAEAQVAAGHFPDIDGVVEAGLLAMQRRQQRHAEKIAAIDAALEEGERSGIAEDYSLENTLAKLGLGDVAT